MADDADTKALVYPKLTQEYLESLIVSEEYFHSEEARTTLIVVVLNTGFSEFEGVICGNVKYYNELAGRIKAKQKLLAKLMDKEHYAMRRVVHMAKLNEGVPNG